MPDDLADDFRSFLPDFAFRLVQLAHLPYEAIRGTPAGVVFLRVMKAERRGELLSAPVSMDDDPETVKPVTPSSARLSKKKLPDEASESGPTTRLSTRKLPDEACGTVLPVAKASGAKRVRREVDQMENGLPGCFRLRASSMKFSASLPLGRLEAHRHDRLEADPPGLHRDPDAVGQDV